MGKYRTFSPKISNLDGALRVSVHGNELHYRRKRRPQLQQLQFLKQSSLWSVLPFFLVAQLRPASSFPISFSIVEDEENPGGSSDPFLLEEEQLNCTPPSSDEFPDDLFTLEERQNGAIVVHFLAVCYMLYALLVVCDEYFVPAIKCICDELKIPHNIAGATLMAVSTSAPELFTNAIGTFVTKGDLGVGTIVGSAVFNVLAVGACVGIGSIFMARRTTPGGKRIKQKGVPLDWWPLTRDCSYYLISVGTLLVILYDGKVYWQEALAMLIIYAFYIAGMCYDTQCKAMAVTFLGKFRSSCLTEEVVSPSRRVSDVIRKVITDDGEGAPLIKKGSQDSSYGSQQNLWNDLGSKTHTKNSNRLSLTSISPHENEDPDSALMSSTDSSSTENSISTPMAFVGGLKDIISAPAKLILWLTIPNCKKEGNSKWCGLALISCVAWIGALSYVISWMVCVIGETFAIPDSVSGLTILAMGTSFPEVISSVIVARQGFGSMAFSNSVGSNTFDILVCLGLPWLIQASILTAKDVNYIEIHSGGLEYSTILLITSLVLLYVMIAASSFALDFKTGITCVIMYAIFITFACLLEMNMFFPVNLPPC